MTKRQMEADERDRITMLTLRLEMLRDTLSKGYTRTLEQRKCAWDVISKQSAAQLASMSESVPDVKPSILPSMSEQRAMGVEPSGDSL